MFEPIFFARAKISGTDSGASLLAKIVSRTEPCFVLRRLTVETSGRLGSVSPCRGLVVSTPARAEIAPVDVRLVPADCCKFATQVQGIAWRKHATRPHLFTSPATASQPPPLPTPQTDRRSTSILRAQGPFPDRLTMRHRVTARCFADPSRLQ